MLKMKISNEMLREKQLLEERIPDEDKETFLQLSEYYQDKDDFKTLLICYRHYLKDIYEKNWGSRVYEPINRPILIGYLVNPDIVFFSELDQIICNYLRNEGAEIIQFTIDDIQIKASKTGLDIFIKNNIVNLDGFLSYGYRSQKNMNAYYTLVKYMEQKGVVCLHSHYHELILNDKSLQNMHFASHFVPIPDTYQVFGISSAKDLAYTKLVGPTIVKYTNDYGGDSVFKVDEKWNVVNAVAKNLWKGEPILLQKMVPDSLGQSIRVLCFEGKAYGMMTYEDYSGDFRSNVSNGDNYGCNSLMNHPKFKTYKEIAEKAISSIGDVLVGGVDILESKSEGVVVLEINSFPDLFDIWKSTKMCTFKRLAEAFVNKIKKTMEKENVEIVFLE
jgi:ribosomal protein S6--L-glutamate ligase